MVSWQFDYEARKSKIEMEDIPNYLRLREFMPKEEAREIQTFQNHLFETYENSIVVSIYSLSEQLLKNVIYSLLEVRFHDDQSNKDKYILSQMPPETYPITPNRERIEKELTVYYSDFKLYSHPWLEQIGYKTSYDKIIKARHSVAHENAHTADIANHFYSALKYVEYLKVSYDFILNRGNLKDIKNLFLLANWLPEFKKFHSYDNYYNVKDKIPNNGHGHPRITFLTGLVNSIEENSDDLQCDYLLELYERLREGYELLLEFDEDNFSEQFADFCNSLDGFDYDKTLP